MTTAHKAVIILSVALFGFLCCALYGWQQEHVAAIVVATQQKADAANAAAIQKEEKDNLANLNLMLNRYAAMKQAVQTPAQVVQALPQVITLPVPVKEITAPQAQAVDDLPDAPKLSAGDLVIPQADVKSFYDAQVDCKAGAAKLASCSRTVADEKAVLAVDSTEIKQLQIALKGGTKWQRTKKALKWVGVGAAIGAGAVAYADHR